MTPLRRHQIARLSSAAWHEILGQPWDAQARGCLRHWAERRLPLVVTRQDEASRRAGRVALGLAAPLAWGRRRIALHAAHAAIACFDEFPAVSGGASDHACDHASKLLRQLPDHARAAFSALLARLDAQHVQARVYGSHGWQLLTGERYVHAASDIDLWVAVDDTAAADAAAQGLAADVIARPRLDGELVFPDGSAVAWREWAAWHNGRARSLLVKRLYSVAIESSPHFGAAAAACGSRGPMTLRTGAAVAA
ncbi:MAG: malonate decarboxylase holo-[acyl-carrier-protein] synthase [Burkholderiales bacterium]|nr:malonate decarboxylase holo-[acyl-carrier-protein] synthase [Burkholderiales bacterium]